MKFCFSPRTGTLLTALAVLMIQSPLRATSYYVDYSAGSDAASGTSTSTPWKHCPGDRAATGVPASNGLAPGDTVYFKGGVAYHLSFPGIVLAYDGAPGKPITYDGNSSQTWGGTNRAIFMDNYDTNTGAMIMSSNQYGFCAFIGLGASDNYLNFFSLELGPIGGSLKLPVDTGRAASAIWGGGIECQSGSLNNVVISNCYFHGLGYWFNQQPMSAGSLGGNGVTTIGFTNLTITNCEFTQMETACELGVSGPSGNLDVGGNKFHDSIVWCVDLALRQNGLTLDNVFIHDNQLYDYSKQFGAGAWSGYGGYGSWPHCDGIFMRGNAEGLNSFTEGTNIDIYNNMFYDTPPQSGGGTASIFLVGSVNANIYNNLFLSPSVANGMVTLGNNIQSFPFYVRIYNNTFFGNGQQALSVGGVMGTGAWLQTTTNTEIDVRNNIFYDRAPANPDNYLEYFTIVNGPAAIANIYQNNNDYCTLNPRPAFMLWTYCGKVNLDGSGTVDNSFRKLMHWETNGIASTPPFAMITNTLYNNSNDYHLSTTNSPVSYGGTNLSYIKWPGFNTDFARNPRPATGPWSMGAYQAGYTSKSSGISQGSTSTNADLEVNNYASSSGVMTNQQVVFTVAVQNAGPDPVPASLNLVITNQLPATFSYVSSSPAGSYNPASGLWTLTGGLTAGGSATLTITAVPTSAGSFTFTSILATPPSIIDANPANNYFSTIVSVTNEVIQAQTGTSGTDSETTGSNTGGTTGATTSNSNANSGSTGTGGTTGGSNPGSESTDGSSSSLEVPPPPTGVKIVKTGS